jgi:hypothetical protein
MWLLILWCLLVLLSSHHAHAARTANQNWNPLSPPKTVLTWINGIGHTIDHMSSGQTYLSALFGNRPVEFCHNPTAMASPDDTRGRIEDLTQCTTQKLGKITVEVEKLAMHLKEAVRKVGKDGRVIHIAHSQGALITYLAIKKLTKEEMRQMEVICFGGAEVIRATEEFPFARCINYYSVNDPLLFVVPQAARALRSGFMGMGYGRMSWSTSSNGPGGGTRGEDVASTLEAMADPNAEPEFVFLTPREGDPVKDHGLFEKTYLDALRWEGRRYQKLYLQPWHPVTYTVMKFSHAFITAFHAVFVKILKIIIKHTLMKLVLMVMSANAWIAQKIFRPFALILFVLWKKVQDLIRIIRGEDLYQPVVILPIEDQEPL